MALTVAVTPGSIGVDVVWSVVVVVHLVRLEVQLPGVTVPRLAPPRSGADGAPAVSVTARHLLGWETLQLLLPGDNDGGDVPQLRQLVVKLVALLVDGWIGVHALLVSRLDLSVPNEPITTFLELLRPPGPRQATRSPAL